MDTRKLFMVVPILFLLIACAVLPGGRTIRGSGKIATEDRPVSGFDQVSVCCGMQLNLTQGSEESLEIEADDNILPEIVSEVVVSKLVVRFKDQTGGIHIQTTSPIRVRVSAVEIRGVDVSGGGRLEAATIDSDRLEIDLSGGSQAGLGSVTAETLRANLSGAGRLTAGEIRVGEVSFDSSGGSRIEVEIIQGDSLTLDASGGGDSRLAGGVTRLEASLSGAAGLQAGDLECDTVHIVMSGGGKSTVWAVDSLSVDLSGGARVDYYGKPQIDQSLSGGSNLESLGEK